MSASLAAIDPPDRAHFAGPPDVVLVEHHIGLQTIADAFDAAEDERVRREGGGQ